MSRPRIIFLLFLWGLASCAPRIPYPATPAGSTLRDFYEAKRPDRLELDSPEQRADLEKAYANLDHINDPATRESLKPAMLAIIRHDDSDRALHVAYLLCQWDHTLPRTAPEFRHLLPALARGLDAPNETDPDRPPQREWSALGSAFLFGQMGAEAAHPELNAIARRFHERLRYPIEGESPEAWTRYTLAKLLSMMGKDGIAALIDSLDGPPEVWHFAREALAEAAHFDEREVTNSFVTVTRAQLTSSTQALHEAMPQIVERLWDRNAQKAGMAAELLPSVVKSEELTPRMRQRLLDLLADEDAYERVARMLALYHPVFTPALLDYVTKPQDPHHQGAMLAIRAILRPDPEKPNAFLEALQRLAIKDPDAEVRAAASAAYEELVRGAVDVPPTRGVGPFRPF